MKSWCHLAVLGLSLTNLLLTGCVYVPAYYFDPVTPAPRPRYFPPERYLPDDYTYRSRRGDERSRRYYYEEGRRAEQGQRRGYDDQTSEDTGGSRNYLPEVTPPSQKEPAPPSPPTQKPNDSRDIPVATKTSKPGRVKVPFPPYNELDVSGMSAGSLAKDPTSGKVFRVP